MIKVNKIVKTLLRTGTKKKLLIFTAGLVFSILFSLLFEPGINTGDSSVYIKAALKILGEDIPEGFSHRSPLYSFLLAIIIKIFGTNTFPRIVVILQFILIYFTSWILYIICFKIFKKSIPSLITSILYSLNLSTIYYGYSILSEILTVFLFIISVYFLILFIQEHRKRYIFLTGITISLLILSRYNTLPLIISYIIVILIIDLKSGQNIKSSLKNLFLFLLMPLLIFNSLSYYNLKKNDFYFLFPNGGSSKISRNALLGTLDGDEKVSPANEPILKIFLGAKAKVSQGKREVKSGSLLKNDKSKIINTLYSGYSIYKSAHGNLCKYYNINPLNAEIILSKKLSSFYQEIYRQSKSQLLLSRFYSILNSFRSSSGITNPIKTNLSKLPGWLIIIYKICFLLISIITFMFTFVYFCKLLIKNKPLNITVFIVIVLCYSFYIINFGFGTVGDANRFKLPSEPLMFGLFLFYIGNAISYFKKIPQKFN